MSQGKKRDWTDAEVAAIHASRARGKSYQKIGETFGVSHTTIRHLLLTARNAAAPKLMVGETIRLKAAFRDRFYPLPKHAEGRITEIDTDKIWVHFRRYPDREIDLPIHLVEPTT